MDTPDARTLLQSAEADLDAARTSLHLAREALLAKGWTDSAETAELILDRLENPADLLGDLARETEETRDADGMDAAGREARRILRPGDGD